MQSAFLIPLSPPGQFSAMLALSFRGNVYVNRLDKVLWAIKQLMCLKFTGVFLVVVFFLFTAFKYWHFPASLPESPRDETHKEITFPLFFSLLMLWSACDGLNHFSALQKKIKQLPKYIQSLAPLIGQNQDWISNLSFINRLKLVFRALLLQEVFPIMLSTAVTLARCELRAHWVLPVLTERTTHLTGDTVVTQHKTLENFYLPNLKINWSSVVMEWRQKRENILLKEQWNTNGFQPVSPNLDCANPGADPV